jgi:DNA-binding transcriptional regulator YbjK
VTITPKGEARRAALLDAVLRVLEREGAVAVTHRSVAAEAGLPLAAATYYFSSLDELYVSALQRATVEQVALLERIDPADLRTTAQVMHEWAHSSRGAAIAQYELMFLAMRRSALRADAELWYRALENAIDPAGEGGRRTRVAALAIDGLLLKILWMGEPSSVDEIEAALREISASAT